MTAFVPAPGIAQVVMKYTSFGNEQLNIWHVAHGDLSAWTLTQLANLNSLFAGWDSDFLSVVRATEFALIQLTARDLTTENALEAQQTSNNGGGHTGGAMPENVSFAVKKNTGLVGRSFRGRVYHIGLTRTQVSESQVNSADAAAILTAYGHLLSLVNAVTNQTLVLLRSQHNGSKLNPRVGQPITSFTTVDTFVDSQRRRLPGHNIHR